MNPKQTFYEHQANTIIANLKKRHGSLTVEYSKKLSQVA